MVQVLQSLGNSVRKATIMSLATARCPLRFSEFMQASGLNPNFDTGHFNYHLSELVKRNIISKVGGEYRLTQFGFKVAKILESLERECSFLLS